MPPVATVGVLEVIIRFARTPSRNTVSEDGQCFVVSDARREISAHVPQKRFVTH